MTSQQTNKQTNKQTEVTSRPVLEKMKAAGFRTPYTTRYRVVTENTEPSLTKQSFKDECDINKIMDRYIKTGVINHVAKHAPTYGEATATDLQDALNLIEAGYDMFMELPAQIRKKFDHDPRKFLEFVQNSENRPKMAEMGLLSPEAEQAYFAEKAATEAAIAASAAKKQPETD